MPACLGRPARARARWKVGQRSCAQFWSQCHWHATAYSPEGPWAPDIFLAELQPCPCGLWPARRARSASFNSACKEQDSRSLALPGLNMAGGEGNAATCRGLPSLPAAGDPNEWERMININLKAPMRLTRALAPAMVKAASRLAALDVQLRRCPVLLAGFGRPSSGENKCVPMLFC